MPKDWSSASIDWGLRSWCKSQIKIGIANSVIKAAIIQISCHAKYTKADTNNIGINASPIENPKFATESAFPRLLTNQRDIATAEM